jgi:succinate-semialdehyde dehydrogenase/glutarate-semialdehyde dehydrogenase
MVTLSDATLWKTRCYLDGEWVGEGVIPVTDPATGGEIARVPDGGASMTEAAVAAAARAFPAWAARSAKDRAGILRRWADLIVEHAGDLAMIMTREQGKPLSEARGEVLYAASFIEWFAEEGKRVYGDLVPSPTPDRRIVVMKQPVGVCAAITPWNFPAAMITRKLGPALAAGCTVVGKPAEQTPLTALALAELSRRAGVPPGVLNLVTGKPEPIGGVLTSSPTVRKLSFTGSTEIGRLLMRQSSDTLKRLSLELGGNAPFIVLEDADLAAAVEGAVASKYRNAGQTCVCANRIFVHAAVYDDFAAKLADRVAALKVGPGSEPGVNIGPLIDEAALAKVEEHVADALAKGGRVTLGGRRHGRGGTFYEPTVITGATAAMKCAVEETFGPVAPLFRFDSDDEVVALANATEYGLAGYLYGNQLSRVWRIAERLELGMVGINAGIISNEVSPFGGIKHSGVGREGGKWGIEEYLEVKYVMFAV